MTTDSREAEALKLAFLQGARWWEYRKTGGTMWQSDQKEAFKAAEELLSIGTLGTLRRAGNAEICGDAEKALRRRTFTMDKPIDGDSQQRLVSRLAARGSASCHDCERPYGHEHGVCPPAVGVGGVLTTNTKLK